ncbi:glycine dehydrogenase (aminomethyl-transferring) [Trebonia kvetii]|uniref:Glycine dehydrogenase (decarboxylating) n=1 Tax=Trebonia kvetii TaxID=2480626 RepID=A0A6P2BQT1_9ACTN|nr:aminomethyl-transferring glycine dehydrogenase [Trebonia kvetii]TVZ00525.1 glycine dehydrogenase (aminomethyl-transferring) [Trebonia kvetii]
MTSPFAARHIGPSEEDQRAMLATLGYHTLDDLLAAALPASARPPGSLAGLPSPLTEQEALAELRDLAARNTVAVSMIGLGYHGTVTPAVIRRNVLENPAWYTAYTPYQPEISQGRLEALLNFQTMVSDLTGLDVANASLLDEASAAAEAMTMARRVAGKANRTVFLADADCLPQTLDVLRTRAEPLGIDLRVAPVTADDTFDGVFGVLLQYPGASGALRDLMPVIEAAHAAGAVVAVAADILGLTLLKPPGEMGADIALGSTQRFGVPMFYGGPHAAYLAVRADLRRQLPGRLVGVSVDADGNPAFRLALQAREQHIRREKATSNICTAQVLLAVVASMYACYHGPDGLTAIARRVHRHALTLAATLKENGLLTTADAAFDTIGVQLPGPTEARAALLRAAEAGYRLHDAGGGVVQVTCDETTRVEHLRDVVAALVGASMVGSGLDAADVRLSVIDSDAIPASLARTSKFLTHPTFSAYHSETGMLRYLRRLSDLDVALDRSMIPLGSCTMKLNATAEMESVTWPEWAGLHPFAPAADAAGYTRLIGDLERWLCAVTGYDACSLQPNAGSAGELAGLLAIRSYHRSRGDDGRDMCLIPESAHGTNAASAVLAGLRVAVVRCGPDGAVDLDDLRAKLAAHEGRVAAIMVTYPSTTGVYEETITTVADLVHEAGGQVYIDGANLNALAGVASLALLGGDVSHLNLHKTFCIPHGGGGPGVGPVAAKSHLAPFLPARIGQGAGEPAGGPVASAPYGSAGILPISWAYIAMMGAAGLRRATQVAVLSANYIARRLAPFYPVVYAGRDGLVAHECIVDLRRLPGGVTVDDVAKRLIDYGFHAPTMSFPVAGTFMIEPTESESLAEIDAFIDALIAIRGEVDKVASGEWDAADNPLKNAPHTAEMLIAGEWSHGYRREDGGYPGGHGARGPAGGRGKYWPPVRRIDQAYGDRNLVCACPPPAAFE